jgi:serine/threonine-protein kinase
MNVTEPFVLEPGVLLIPCRDLSEDVRRRISFEEGDFTLSQRYGRTLAQVIDGGTAALLALFREPRTIVDAIVENSRALGADAAARLDEMLPHLGAFVESRVLVPASAVRETELRPRYDARREIRGWKIVRCVSLVEDTEIYQVHGGALKIARHAAGLQQLFDNEIAILRHLDGSDIAPRLLDAGVVDERPYLVAEWIDGVDAAVAAAQRRHDRAALIEICASIAAAYAALHARGVLHADVHARNVLVGERVTLLDFGYSRLADAPEGKRGGVYSFFEPEYFTAGAAPSAAGEQYAVGALLYAVVTGKHYLDLRLDREEMRRQIVSEPPLPLVPPWPEVESILFRALEKEPARRHASVAEMAARLARVRDETAAALLATPLSDEANALLASTLRSFARGGAMFASGYTSAPTASINFGAAGAAIGLLRIATARGDAALLALADVWRSRAAARIGAEGAYWNDDGLPHETVGDVTPYHTESGIHAAAAMIAAARGDTFGLRRAIASFIAASTRPCDVLDLTLGRSGTLLACAMLVELSGDAALRAFGSATMRAIWRELDARPPIADSPPNTYLGMAHGWAGYLYAALRWCAVSGDALPPRLAERLHEYDALKTLDGRGAFWRVKVEPTLYPTMPGWCNGNAGQLFLFTLAHRVLGDAHWLHVAELCAWDTWDQPYATSTLCCGSAGRAYALLNFYKYTGDAIWLSRARHLANHAASTASSTAQRAQSLWKGELGVAVLIADLASPENACMPFFE